VILVDPYEAILLDLDGVLYRGAEPVAGAPEAVARLRTLGKRIAFVTNNSSRTPTAVAATLTDVGIEAEADEVETSALVTADLLAGRGIVDAFVVGEGGLLGALRAKGIRPADRGVDHVDVVVVGLDRRVDYAKLVSACLLVERGAALVATNADASFPAPDGVCPGRSHRQAAAAALARGPRPRGRRAAAPDRRPARHGHRRRRRARMGLAARADGDLYEGGSRGRIGRADVRR